MMLAIREYSAVLSDLKGTASDGRVWRLRWSICFAPWMSECQSVSRDEHRLQQTNIFKKENTNKHIHLNLECKNQAWLSWALFVCLHPSRSQKSQVLASWCLALTAALSTFISGTGYAIKEIRIPRVFFFFPFLLSISTAHIQQQKIQIFKPK